MTIREYLDRQITLVRAIYFVAIAALVVAIIFFPDVASRHGVAGYAALLGATVLATGRIMLKAVCPQCKGFLGEHVAAGIIGGQLRAHARCPHCGISLDEPMAP